MSLDVVVPPIDLAPRTRSIDPAAFVEPTSRDEEWKFSAFNRLKQFFTPDSSAGVVRATGVGVQMLPIAQVASTWIPTDLAAAVARANISEAGVLEIAAQAVIDEPIVVDVTTSTTKAYQHLEIIAGHFSSATVVIRQNLTSEINGSTVVTVGDNARLTVITIIEGGDSTTLALQMPVALGRDSHYTSALAVVGGGAVRIQNSVTYTAPGGTAELFGVFLADSGQHIEQRIFVHHDQAHCKSDVMYKGALLNPGARSVWIGDVLVRKEAVGTDTHQVNRNLLLSQGARADSVPNLELETGDIVKAGHASATGRFDDEQVFYLQSRGIPLETARQLVVRGFFAEVLGRIGNQFWRDELLAKISSRLGIESLEGDDE